MSEPLSPDLRPAEKAPQPSAQGPKKRRASGLVFAILVLAALLIVAAVSGLGKGDDVPSPSPTVEQPAQTEEAPEEAPADPPTPVAEEADELAVPEEPEPELPATFTIDTARDACVTEGTRLFPGLSPNWQDRGALQKQQGNAWFVKAPASSDAPSYGWFICKVGGTPAAPEFYVTKLN